MSARYNSPLRVAELLATRIAEKDRGTKVWMNREEARARLLTDGELVWVYGPRRHELAELAVDDRVARGHVILRDVAGAAPSEVVTIVKVNTDLDPRPDRRA